MGLTANDTEKSWFPRMNWPVLVIVGLAIILLTLLYFKVVAPRLQERADTERDMPAIKVVIKNGCGVEGLAAGYSRFLKDKNIDVVGMGDTPHPIYNKSLIEVKTEDRDDLRRLQNMTGIQRFILAVDSSYEAPFIIILGADYEDLMKR